MSVVTCRGDAPQPREARGAGRARRASSSAIGCVALVADSACSTIRGLRRGWARRTRDRQDHASPRWAGRAAHESRSRRVRDRRGWGGVGGRPSFCSSSPHVAPGARRGDERTDPSRRVTEGLGTSLAVRTVGGGAGRRAACPRRRDDGVHERGEHGVHEGRGSFIPGSERALARSAGNGSRILSKRVVEERRPPAHSHVGLRSPRRVDCKTGPLRRARLGAPRSREQSEPPHLEPTPSPSSPPPMATRHRARNTKTGRNGLGALTTRQRPPLCSRHPRAGTPSAASTSGQLVVVATVQSGGPATRRRSYTSPPTEACSRDTFLLRPHSEGTRSGRRCHRHCSPSDTWRRIRDP